MNGSMGFQAQRVTRYAERMKAALTDMGLTVDLVLWDERSTTERANDLLANRGHKKRDSRHSIDALAAAVILQSYLDKQVGQ